MPATQKDWTGNNKSIFSTLGSSAHSQTTRETDDFYATHPSVVEELLKVETFHPFIWEPATGTGHISEVLLSHGYKVRSTDLIYRGYGEEEPLDFLSFTTGEPNKYVAGDIITNPPYKHAQEFVEKALSVIGSGHKVAMLLKLQFLEGQKRQRLFTEAPPLSHLRLHSQTAVRKKRRLRPHHKLRGMLRMVRLDKGCETRSGNQMDIGEIHEQQKFYIERRTLKPNKAHHFRYEGRRTSYLERQELECRTYRSRRKSQAMGGK